MKYKIVFYFPWQEISGGPNYLSTLANALANDNNYEVYYIDYPEGLTNNLLSKSINRINYEEPFSFPIQDEVTLITPIYCASHIPLLHPNSKVLFVNWHNYCIQALLNVWRLDEKNLQQFLWMIYKKNAVFFLDRAHWMAQNEWIKPKGSYCFLEQYVPGQISVRNNHIKREKTTSEGINLAVLGRLSNDKIYAVLNLLQEIEKLPQELQKNIYVIGDGPGRSLLENYRIKSNLQLYLIGTITGKELETFLIEQIDVLFGMGLSILEGGAVGLPSVIIPHGIKPFSTNKFTYLQESQGCMLGWYSEQIEELKIPWHPLQEILEDIVIKNKKILLGDRAYEYTKTIHRPDAYYLKQIIAKTNLLAKDFNRFAKQQGKLRLLGIPVGHLSTSFDETEKTIHFLGIENFLKFKRTATGEKIFLLGKEQKIFSARKEKGKFRLFFLGKRIPLLKL